jgi:hypothetical protein
LMLGGGAMLSAGYAGVKSDGWLIPLIMGSIILGIALGLIAGFSLALSSLKDTRSRYTVSSPVEVAGITVEGENKWLTIIQNASQEKERSQ